MTNPITQATSELYDYLGCADNPRGKAARLLQAIDLAAEAEDDPMRTRISPLQREAVVRELIREARDAGYNDEDSEILIPWLWSRLPDALDTEDQA